MLYFGSDYVKGTHKKILEAILKTNDEGLPGYGTDKYTENAKKKIRQACKKENADIFFLVGGTQTNAIVINSLLKAYEGVIAADTGHISTHEAGAIEFTGHKVLTLPNHNGKINAEELNDFLRTYHGDGNNEHMVYPAMVYISHPTEYGTLYSKDEMTGISKICKEYGIPLFLDGARLGYGIMSKESDIDLPFVAEVCDIFYIGGTKVGAMFGEAVVFPKGNAPKRYVSIIKNQGGLLAKGRFLGIQFETLFSDNLYFEISRHAIEMAEFLKKRLKDKGYKFYLDSPTNQQFIIIDNKKMEELSKEVNFSFWEKYDEKSAIIRLATSWSTTEEEVEKLMELL